jgi:anthranilate/para-aminobenzoate synthase component II
MKATMIDFEDSFTYNVVQELTETGFDVEVVHWKDYEKNPKDGPLVLGPGPGHPDDYQNIFPLLRNWLDEEKPFFGICLGHQIFWRLHHEEIVRSKSPLHGQKIQLMLTQEWRDWLGVNEDIYVQRYNSLAVMGEAAIRNPNFKNFIYNDEILITRAPGVITYQFHPESVGTTFRKEFIKVIHSII